jgi:hypothetical protein
MADTRKSTEQGSTTAIEPDAEALRKKFKCPELYRLDRIPDEDINSGRHSMAECAAPGEDCRNPVRYKMVVITFDDFLDTDYFCEAHKPD